MLNKNEMLSHYPMHEYQTTLYHNSSNKHYTKIMFILIAFSSVVSVYKFEKDLAYQVKYIS